VTACSRHVPKDTAMYARFADAIKQLTFTVSDPSSGEPQSQATAELGALVQKDIDNKMSLGALQRYGVLNLEEALLAAHEMWTSELEWRRLHNLAACCRASVHWQNFTWKDAGAKMALPHVAVLSGFHTNSNNLSNNNSLAQRTNLSNGDVAKLVGKMQGARLVGLNSTRAMQLLSSQVSKEEANDVTPPLAISEEPTGVVQDVGDAADVPAVALPTPEGELAPALSTPRKVRQSCNNFFILVVESI
jgi:hypothetical protein